MDISMLENFKSTVVRPADFDAFWDETLALTAKIPFNVSMEHVPLRSTAEVDVFRVHFDSYGGVRLAAWYCLPKDHQGQLPGLSFIPGYISDPIIPKAVAKRGYAALCVACRGKIGSLDQFNPGYPGLLTHNIVDRNSYGYRGFFMDVVRAIDFLDSRDEVNSDRLGVYGDSQGGGLTLVAAGLSPKVRVASSGVPFLCGYMDALQLTHTHPYFEIQDYLRRYPKREADVRRTLAYYDGTNFGPRITCPIIVNVGMQDNTCPPETGYAAFKAIASTDKTFYPYDGHGHDGGKICHYDLADAFLDSHLKA